MISGIDNGETVIGIRALMVEDHPGDARLIQELVREDASRPIALDVCTDLASALHALSQRTYDVVLCDLGLPDCTGLQTVSRIVDAAGSAPALVLTGQDDLQLASQCLVEGAHDYICKNRVGAEINALMYNALERSRLHSKLDQAQQNLRNLVRDSEDGMLILDGQHRVVFANPTALTLFEGRLAEGDDFGMPLTGEGPTVVEITTREGAVRHVELRMHPTQWCDREAQVVNLRDITARVADRQRIEHLNRVLRAIRNVNQLIVTEDDPAALINQACALLIETRGYNAAWIGLGGAETPTPIYAQAGWADDFDEIAKSMREGVWPPCVAKAVEEPECHVVPLPKKACGPCPLAGRYGDGYAVVTTLRHDATVFGFLGVSFPKTMTVDQQERDLLTEVAGDIAFALHKIEIAARQRDTEALLKAAVRGGNVGLWDWDLLTGKVAFSDEWKMQIGYLPAEIDDTYLEWATRVHPEDLPTVLESMERALSDPQGSYEMEFRLRHKDHSYRWILARGSVARDPSGRPLRMRGSHIDITDNRKQREQHWRAQRIARIGHWELSAVDAAPHWSEEIFRIFGLDPKGAAPSFTAHDTVVHPDDWPTLNEAVQRGFAEGAPFDLHFRIVRSTGDIGWMHAIGEPAKDEAGRVVMLFGTAQDVTERWRSREALRQSKELLETVANNYPNAYVSIIDKDLRVGMSAGQAFSRRGLDPAAFVGLTIDAVFDKEADTVRQEYLKTFAGEQRSFELLIDGEYQHYRTVPLPAPDGSIPRILVVVENITERRRMETQLAQADRLSSMGMLAAGVAHEINNPLSYVLYNLESLSHDLPQMFRALRDSRGSFDDDLGEDGAERTAPQDAQRLSPSTLDDLQDRLSDALKGVYRIRDVCRGLGTFSRVEKDQLAAVELTRVIEVALDMAFNEIKYRARLVKEYGRNLPLVHASEGRLGQVFLNLVINAAHAIGEGDLDHNEIRVRTWAEQGRVCAEVRDTGSGIAPENLKVLFEPFFTTKQIGVGSGLGLAISKNIIEGYGGTIEVESELGRGTRFVVTLPVREPTTEAVDAATGPAETAAVRGRVLIVDDEASLRLAMKRMLREHETVMVGSGAEAQDLLKTDQAFDLILCDVMMPDVSGMDLHRWLVEHYPALSRQLIFVTGGAFTPKAREYLGKVDNLRLDKPFDVANFKRIVSDAIVAGRRRP